MKKLTLIKSVAAAVAVIGSGVAMAATYAAPSGTGSVTTNMAVSAKVVHFCKTQSASVLKFEDFRADTAKDTTATVSVACTSTSPIEILLGAGANGGSASGARKMSDGGSNTIDYNLYSDSTRTVNWGDTTGSAGNTVTGSGAGLGTAVENTVYGRIPVQEGAVPGSYTDTVLVTINY